jgi:hypothetical protein
MLSLVQLMDVELSSVPGAFHAGIVVLMGFTIYALFRHRNLGRFLAAAQFLLGAALIGVACFLALRKGAELTGLLPQLLNAIVQLVPALLLLFGRSAKRYAARGSQGVST